MEPEPNLARRAGEAFDRLLADCGRALVALSGGPDSLALLVLATEWARARGGPAVSAATVDHGLRPESADEARRCAAVAESCGAAHVVLPWVGPRPATGVQEAAREARYSLLADHARAIGATHLLTAHHADDQAETVLMRLIAGSGVAGLAGMAETSERAGLRLVRPLLFATKAELTAFCAARSLAPASDPTNADRRFLRPRLRALMPALAREGLSVQRLNRLASRAARAEAALQSAAAAAWRRVLLKRSPCAVRIDWRSAATMPAEMRLRTLAVAIDALGADDAPAPRLEQLEDALQAIDGACRAGDRHRRTLAGRMITLQAGGVLVVSRQPPRATPRDSRQTASTTP